MSDSTHDNADYVNHILALWVKSFLLLLGVVFAFLVGMLIAAAQDWLYL